MGCVVKLEARMKASAKADLWVRIQKFIRITISNV
jgi:hypothetical protein